MERLLSIRRYLFFLFFSHLLLSPLLLIYPCVTLKIVHSACVGTFFSSFLFIDWFSSSQPPPPLDTIVCM